MIVITVMADLYCIGVRKLVSYQRLQNHECDLIFFPDIETLAGSGTKGTGDPSSEDLRILAKYIKNYSVIGISAMSDYLPRANAIGFYLKKRYPGKIFIMGGIAPTVDPGTCLKSSWIDGVCIGEGEIATDLFLKSLEKGESYYQTPGYYFRKKRQIIANGYPVLMDVNKLPWVNYADGVLLRNGEIRFVNETDLKINFGTTLWLSSSRGCPFHCAYCINSGLPPGRKKPRFHSAEYIIGEIKNCLDSFPFFNCISFQDESIAAQDKKNFYVFLKHYKKQINLPWVSYVDPFTLTFADIDNMVAANCKKIKIGMQTGSRKVNQEIFHRADALAKFPAILKKINPLKNGLSLPIIDLITDVPWMSNEDFEKELVYLNSLPRPFTLEVFKLCYYPGTYLYRRALTEKIISKDNWHAQDPIAGSNLFYGGILLRIIGMVHIPDKLLAFMIRKKIIYSRTRIPVIPQIVHQIIIARKLIRQLIVRDPTSLPYFFGSRLRSELARG